MAKNKVTKAFFCQNCGAQHSQWMGQCKSCGQWNTIVEEVVDRGDVPKAWESSSTRSETTNHARTLSEVEFKLEDRSPTHDGELDRVLGGGIVPGSLILLGGEPGIGKSTLMLQLALRIQRKVLYISGEESERQIKMRAERIGIDNQETYILNETQTQKIFREIKEVDPDLVIVDSVQTLTTQHIDSLAGSVSQIRESTAEFIQFAKKTHTPVILIGHINKDGQLAGPKILEHMVDVVLQFEGDQNHVYRLLRAHKNRFGSTAEIGIYEMAGSGLREVPNPSDILISRKDGNLSGIAIASMMEGLRPLLIEIQALVSTAVYGTPQRASTGFDTRRLNMLLAVLEKRCGFRLGAKDVFLNVTGGIRVDDPAIDLAVVAAILSSNEDIPVPDRNCFAAEVGLAGEVRPVTRVEQRIMEAEKLGFDTIHISRYNKVKPGDYGIKVKMIGKVEELFGELFG
ncbi:MAG: DNA repair protein RadA [Bacteroidota bacterium]|nr:DNA repair protein RadA [Bacteroidota bacterium]MDX5504512.1 DNA repair protein RadA [Bacteroidota bacterium]